MDERNKVTAVSKIVGTLVESEASALEVLEVLERAKETFLDRCWHVSSNKKSLQVAGTTSEEGKIKGITIQVSNTEPTVEINIPDNMKPTEVVSSIKKQLGEYVSKLPLDF